MFLPINPSSKSKELKSDWIMEQPISASITQLKEGKRFLSSGNYAAALEKFKQVLEINPYQTEAYILSGDALFKLNHFSGAKKAYQIALSYTSEDPKVLYKMALCYFKEQQFVEAEKYFLLALQKNPFLVDAYNGLYLIYKQHLDFVKARKILELGCSTNPQVASLHNNLANVCFASGDYQGALAAYNAALTIAPKFPEASVGKGMIHLLKEDFEHGWPEYEHRLQLPFYQNFLKNLNVPFWDGTPAKDKTLLIWTEQGLGDAIQFARFLPRLKNSFKKIVIACQPSLINLFKTLEGVDEVFSKDHLHEHPFDFHLPIMSLGKFFVKREQDLKIKQSYFNLNLKDILNLQKKLALNEAMINIGIVWGGNIKHKNDLFRSSHVKYFKSLLKIPQIRLFSLQKGPYQKQLQEDPALPIKDLAPLMHDFYETALIIANLDLIISVDTAVAHLAGALFRPVWLLLPQFPDWRWLLKRSDSPWYPTMRIFRQEQQGEWQTVFKEVKQKLAQFKK